MGRPRDRRKRSRARAAAEEDGDEALFPVGAAVEVRVDDPGFEGSLYEATVEGYLPSGRGYVVAYDTLASREDGGGSPLREHVVAAAADVRPRPPAAASPRREFSLHETVDAFHNEGWWAGVVQAVPAAGGDARVYTVCFPATREVLQFDETRLRPRLVFLALGDRWVPAAQAPENRSPMFREGTQVEVSRSPKTFGEYWTPATVLKVIDATCFLVQYGDAREDGQLITEIMDAQYIRPARNIIRMGSKYRFPPSSFVEVIHEGSWWPGVISEVLDDRLVKKYVVKINSSHETRMDDGEWVDLLTVEHTQLRPRYDWFGRKWVRCLTEKQFNRGPRPMSAKKPIAFSVQSSNHTDNTAASASCIHSDEIRNTDSSGEEQMDNADAELEAVCPDLVVCNENVQTEHKLGSCPKETLQQQNSLLAVTTPLALPSQLFVSGFGDLKDQFKLSCPRMISMPSVPQTGQSQASLFGAFGQLRPLPQGPVLGIQSFNPDFASVGGSKNPFMVQEKQPTDTGYYLMAGPQQNINAESFVGRLGTDLSKKRKEFISTQTPEELGENPEIVLTKKRIVDKNVEETRQDVASSEEQNKLQNDYDKYLPDDAAHRPSILSELDKLASSDSTPLKENKGSHESNVFWRESTAADEAGLSGILIGTDEPHQGGYVGVPRHSAAKVSILSENAVHSVGTLDEPCEANVLLSDSLNHQCGHEATRAENSEIIMEQETAEEFCQQFLVLADDASADLLPSTKSCEVMRSDHQLRKDSIATMVQLDTICAVPTDNMSTMAVAMSRDVVPNLFLSSENCESDKKADTGVTDCHVNKMQLSSNMPETQHASSDSPFTATSFPGFKGDISIKQSSTKKSVADEHGVPHQDRSSPMVEVAAECDQSTDNSALTLLSSADGSHSTETEHGNRLIEPKDAEGTPMSKYVPCRTWDSSRPLVQRSLDAHRSILADRPSESLAVENLPFVKTSPMWAEIEAMEVFSRLPQRADFCQFQQHAPEVREGMALGLMLSFACLAESIEQLNAQEENAVFEDKMKGLSSLEAHGFDVTHLRSHMETLLYKKNRRAELQNAIRKFEEKISHEETVHRQHGVRIGMLNSTIRQLDLHAYLLRGVTRAVVTQDINHAVEISRLKAEASELRRLDLSAEECISSAGPAP